jgi:hypothetical protein
MKQEDEMKEPATKILEYLILALKDQARKISWYIML